MQARMITYILLSVRDSADSIVVTYNSVIFSRLGHCKILCKRLGMDGDMEP